MIGPGVSSDAFESIISRCCFTKFLDSSQRVRPVVINGRQSDSLAKVSRKLVPVFLHRMEEEGCALLRRGVNGGKVNVSLSGLCEGGGLKDLQWQGLPFTGVVAGGASSRASKRLLWGALRKRRREVSVSMPSCILSRVGLS